MSKRLIKDTSWQKVSSWYHQKQGLRGSYYYRQIIIPKTLALLDIHSGESLLDLGCGQGVLERALKSGIKYTGVDLARDLLKYANDNKHDPNHRFLLGDITRPLSIKDRYDKIALILTLQNLANLAGLFANMAKHLQPTGQIVIVLNHPFYRIPRQTAWEIDETNKLQYRRINRYQNAFKVPINMNPGSKEVGSITWSFHYPLWEISRQAEKEGLVISRIEEWVSDKVSVGKAARMENLARAEIPMFMALRMVFNAPLR